MASIDKTKDEDFDVCWARGDDDPKVFTLTKADGTADDISGQTLSMAVNLDKNPGDTVNEIFVVVGVLIDEGSGAGVTGKVSFTPPPNSLDAITAPGKAYYDINRLTPNKKTLVKGRVIFEMDVDKS